MVNLSVIIVSFNTRELLKACIKSIYDETKIKRIEIIVVDNASIDNSVEMVRLSFPDIVVIENENNVGFAAANNQGIAIAHGEYVLFLNSDTVILNNALDKMYDFMESNVDVGIAGCRQLYPTFKLQHSCRSFPTLWNIFTESTFLYKIFPKSKLFGQYYLSYFDYNTIKEIDVVMGSFMFIRKKVIEDVKGFDDSFFFYTEETDLCFRAKSKGYKSFYYPGAEIIHIGGGSSKNMSWMFKHLHHSQYQFINKHYSGINNILMRILKRFGIVMRIPVYFAGCVILFDNVLLEKAIIHLKLALFNFNSKKSK